MRSLFDDLRDGQVLLQAFDKVIPGSVIWKRVSKPKAGGVELGGRVEAEEEEGEEGETRRSEMSRFKMVENCNYSIELAKREGMHMVGVRYPYSVTF